MGVGFFKPYSIRTILDSEVLFFSNHERGKTNNLYLRVRLLRAACVNPKNVEIIIWKGWEGWKGKGGVRGAVFGLLKEQNCQQKG